MIKFLHTILYLELSRVSPPIKKTASGVYVLNIMFQNTDGKISILKIKLFLFSGLPSPY